MDTKKKIIFAVIILIICIISGLIIYQRITSTSSNHNETEMHSHEHEHEAYHEGSLNAIKSCHLGHIEIKVENDLIKCWFVGGDQDTENSIRISDEKIVFSVTLPDGTKKELRIYAKPLELAGEKIGDCSYFEGNAEWLKSYKEFTADSTSKIDIKGIKTELKIVFPGGYHPEHEHHDEEDNHIQNEN